MRDNPVSKAWRFFSTASLMLFFCSMGISASATDYQAQLDAMIARQYSDYSATRSYWTGAFAVLISSPKGDFFATSGAPGYTPPTADTFYRAASTTKIFTAAAIVLLQQQGKLNLDDCMTNFIPGTSTPYLPATSDYNIPYKNQITVRQLLLHTAGVFDVANDSFPTNAPVPFAGSNFLDYTMGLLGSNHTFTTGKLIDAIARAGVSSSPPGTNYQYSDTGYTLLGKIIERVSGMSYANFLQTRFLAPLGLTHTRFPDQGADQTLPSPFATGYSTPDGSHVLETTHYNVSYAVAEGNIVTTPRDLLRWNKLLFSSQAGLNTQSVRLLETNIIAGSPSLGYGHSGALAGYVTDVRYDPAHDVAVLALATMRDFSGTNNSGTMNELHTIYSIELDARHILGYTAPAFSLSAFIVTNLGLLAVIMSRRRRVKN